MATIRMCLECDNRYQSEDIRCPSCGEASGEPIDQAPGCQRCAVLLAALGAALDGLEFARSITNCEADSNLLLAVALAARAVADKSEEAG